MIVQKVFGRTEHISSRVLLGAAAFRQASQEETDAAMDLALSQGVNHVDVAASYGDAELRVGDWIRRHGKPFFLATKTGERTATLARDQIHRSLERLQVDRVDLLQLHNLVDPQEWETALGPGGALEAAIEARAQGLVRWIGITGHGLTVAAMHRRALERFAFDSVLLPLNFPMARNAEYLAEFDRLMNLCRARTVAVQTIKSIAHSPWGESAPTRATWYRPLEDQASIDRAVHWVLGHADVFLNSAADVHLLPKVLDAANRFETPPPDDEMRATAETLEMQPLFT